MSLGGGLGGDRLRMTQLHDSGASPAFSNPPVPEAAGSNKSLTSVRNSQTMAERLHYGRVTWLGGAATASVASIKSASQTVLGSALGKLERSIKIPISASDTRRKHEPRRC